MNGISEEDTRDDSTANSDYSASSRLNELKFVNLPSMLSPSSTASINDDASIDNASNRLSRRKVPKPTERPNDIGFQSTFNIPRPFVDKGGVEMTVPSDGNRHVNEQLPKHNSKKKATCAAMRSISNAAEYPYEIDKWIQSVAETHTDSFKTEVTYRNQMPTIQDLLQSWPEKLGEELKNGTIELPPVDIDLSVEEYARIMCSLLGIPVYDGCVIESVHVLLNLFVDLQNSSGSM